MAPKTPTLEQTLAGAERARQRVAAWPKWKRELSMKRTDPKEALAALQKTLEGLQCRSRGRVTVMESEGKHSFAVTRDLSETSVKTEDSQSATHTFEAMERKQMKVEWRVGHPPKEYIGPFWVCRTDGMRELLYNGYDGNSSFVTHWAPAELPDPPAVKPEPGWYMVRQGRVALVLEVVDGSEHLYDCVGGRWCTWDNYEFGPRVERPPWARI